MDKREIVSLLLENGIMLTPEELERTDERKCRELVGKGSPGKEGCSIKVLSGARGKITASEFVKKHREKFEFLKDVLAKKTEAVSINKGRKVFSEVSVIGRVRETRGNGFLLEDVTGEAEVVSGEKDINPGDILGVRGNFRDNKILSSQIIWPGIPLVQARTAPKDIRIIFSARKKKTGSFLVCPEPGGTIEEGFGSAGFIKIERPEGHVSILAYSPSGKLSKEECILILKKRSLPQEAGPDTLIRHVPDIFCVYNNADNWTQNYKGVIIISVEEKSAAEYDNGSVRFSRI